MSLHNLYTTLTPAEFAELQELANKSGKRLAKRWVAAQAEAFYQEWEALPDGSHLKGIYRDEVWTWSDRDLAAMDDVFAQPSGLVREGLDGPEVYCIPDGQPRAGRRPARKG